MPTTMVIPIMAEMLSSIPVIQSPMNTAAMALSGCVAVTEPAFWAGWDRSTAEGFEDYFKQLMDFEPKRAAQHHIQHYTWLGMNPLARACSSVLKNSRSRDSNAVGQLLR